MTENNKTSLPGSSLDQEEKATEAGAGKPRGGKRPASEQTNDTPSPQSKRPDQRSKLASGTYAQAATKMIRDGAGVVGCTDEESRIWLKSLFPDNKIGGRLIRVVQPEELPKRHRVVIHVDEVVSAREVTALMDRQNPGLNAKGLLRPAISDLTVEARELQLSPWKNPARRRRRRQRSLTSEPFNGSCVDRGRPDQSAS
ncbi:hypothetical protein PV326_009224 [Microctonus aethiopoides]|nr:hypothetical protein PV326_009224 [Microctonus aethiopoides]